MSALPFAILPIKDGDRFMVRPIRFLATETDITPDQFQLPAVLNQPTGQLVELASPVIVSGLSDDVMVAADLDYTQSDATAFMSVNGGAWRQAAQDVRNGDQILLRVMTSDEDGQIVQVRLSIGSVWAVWTVSTSDAVVPPPAVGFTRSLAAIARTLQAIVFGFTASRAGQYRMVVTLPNQTPTAAEVLAGTGPSGATPIHVTPITEMLAGIPVTETVSGLQQSTAYRASLVLVDGEGNQSMATILAMTTSPAVAGPGRGNRLSPPIAVSLTPPVTPLETTLRN